MATLARASILRFPPSGDGSYRSTVVTKSVATAVNYLRRHRCTAPAAPGPDAGEVDNNNFASETSLMEALALLNGF